MVEVAAVHGNANASLAAGYGYTGILVAFLARHNPLAIIPVAILLGGIGATGGLLQRRLGPARRHRAGAAGHHLRRHPRQRDALRPLRTSCRRERPDGTTDRLGLWGVPLAMLGGAIRVSTPFLFVSLGECITERTGRINLGLEGTLVMGAMSGYGIVLSDSGSPWLGVLAAGVAGALLGALHAGICKLPRVNDIAVGIALMLFGTGLAFFLGKPYIQPKAPDLPAIDLGWWSNIPQVPRGAAGQRALPDRRRARPRSWPGRSSNTRWGLIVRTVGDSADAARAMGYSVNAVRLLATTVGGVLAGIGGVFLSLYYPGSWNEGLSSGQGLMAVALVIFARWDPLRCFWAALLFGGAGALGPGAAIGRRHRRATTSSTPRPTC